MLALCWLIFRSWASFSRSWTPLARLLGVFYSCSSFFSRFRSLRVGFGDVQRQFGGSETAFFGVLSRARVCNAKKLRMCKKRQFFMCFCMVFTYCELCLQATKQRKIIPGACSTEPPAKIVLPFRLEMDSGEVWRSLGRHLTGFCSLLGGFWPLLGTSWASLGHFLDALGCLLAALWSCTAAFRFPGPSQASILKGLGAAQTEF